MTHSSSSSFITTEGFKDFSGDGITTTYIFGFNHPEEHTNAVVVEPKSDDAKLYSFKMTWVHNLITITYEKPPPLGTNNLSFYYRVS
jgi:hypothetical protein